MSTPLRSRLPVFALALAMTVGCAFPATAEPGDGKAASPIFSSERMPGPPRPLGERVARIALGEVGVPYRWGGESPSTGFDCSGLVRWAYGRVGIDVPHSSYALYGTGKRVPEERIEPGDILFFEGLGHVGLYLGGGRMVHAPQTGRSVEVVRLGSTNYGPRLVAARRVA